MDPRPSPTLVPEILARIARFIPCWGLDHKCTRSKFHSILDYKYQPETLCQCILVCRLWYLTFKPCLWEVMNGKYFEKIPKEIVYRNCTYFRVFASFSAHPGPYKECTNLFDLSLSQCETFETGVQLHTQRELVKQNRNLRSLYWHGPNTLMDLDLDSLIPPPLEAAAGQKCGFIHLNNLTLLKWDASTGRITKILESVAGTLTSLSLYSMYGINSEDLYLRSYDSNLETTGPRAYLAAEDGPSLLVLPNVVRLAFRINHHESTGLEDLVKTCPNVRKLSIILDKDFDIDRLTNNIRNHCTMVEALTMKYAFHDEEVLFKILDACRSAPQGSTSAPENPWMERSLARLRLCVRNLSQMVTDNILGHANTLVVLKLKVMFGENFNVEGLLQILTYCRVMKRLLITGGGVTKLSLLEAHLFGSGPWGCQDLEQLRLGVILTADVIVEEEASSTKPTSAPEQDEDSDDDMALEFYLEPEEIKALYMAIGSFGMAARFGMHASTGRITRKGFNELKEMERMTSTHPVWGWTLIPPRGSTNMTVEKVEPQKNTQFLRKLLKHCSTMPLMETLIWNDLSFRKASLLVPHN